MWDITDRCVATLAQDHDVLGVLDFLGTDGGEPELTSASDDRLGIVLGSRMSQVVFEQASVAVGPGAVRRQASSIVVKDDENDPQLKPVIDQGLLIVGQSEIRIWAGVRYWDATTADVGESAFEILPVMTGPITNVDLRNYPIVTMQASDRMWYLTQEFSQAYTPTATQTVDDAIDALLRFKVPVNKYSVNLPTTEVTVGLLTFDEQSIPTDAIVKMATAAGWTIYCDPMGMFVATSEPELRPEDVVLTYAGGEGGMLIQPALTYDVQNVVNTWVVTGEAPNTGQQSVPYAKVTDDDPNSPTYVRAPYDERPRFISSPILTTDAQCLVAAKTYRKREAGLAFSVTADIFPNPALERGDVLHIDNGDDLDQLVIADSFPVNIPGTEQQTVVGRVGVFITDE